MPLIDLKTDLKSLKFGRDRLGGGDSGQPYITSPIPEETSTLGILDNDFLLRGGITVVSDSGEDVLRLGKMFLDTKSPSGILFLAKQNLLSRTAVRTQTSGILNEGIYTPLSTLAQAGVNAFGGHLNKQGINPFSLTGAYSNNDNLYGVKVKNNQPIEENRLVSLYQNITDNTSTSNWNFSGVDINVGVNILSYGGGPGSVLGIGKTNIRFADQRTGEKNPNYKGNDTPKQDLPKYTPTDNLLDFKSYILNNPDNPSFKGVKIYNKTLASPPQINAKTNALNTSGEDINPSTLSTIRLEDAKLQDEVGDGFAGGIKQDFREELRAGLNQSQILSDAPSYIPGQGKTIDGEGQSRINYNNPANKQRNLISYTSGSRVGPVDIINALPIYKSENVTKNDIKNDLVKFRIAVIDNADPSKKTFIHFRSYLNSFTDSYNANWNPTKYLGRGEEFYNYGGFGRTVSLGWTVAAQSKEELIPMYKKLNYLASSLAPDYSRNGYMKGNLIELTIGGYFYQQPGIITGMQLSINDDTPYEIGINDEGKFDSTVKELPMIIRVAGFNFTPIHNFRPSLQTITTPMTDASLTDTNTYGDQRYIALQAGNNNYDN